MSKHQQKIVTLGGGTGHFSLLRGLVDFNEPEMITAITGTWDSGGSSGRLRVEMGVLPSGDTRQCLLALMEDDAQRQVAQKLFNERFKDIEGPLKGHALGNLIQSQLQLLYQGADRGLDAARALFRVRGQIVPISLSDLQLNAKTVEGNILEGETLIDTRGEEKDFDEKCAMFLGVNYELVVNYVNEGLTDQAVLQSCFGMGHRPSDGEIHMWNEFMRKRGWNDELSGTLESQKKKHAMLSRSEIQTAFQFIDADEGRLVNDNHAKAPRIRKRITIRAREWPSGQDKDNSNSSERVGSPRAQRRARHLSRRVGCQ